MIDEWTWIETAVSDRGYNRTADGVAVPPRAIERAIDNQDHCVNFDC